MAEPMKPRENVTEREMRYVVEPLILPRGEFGAHIEVLRFGPRGGAEHYVRVGPRVVAGTPQKALEDLRIALYTDRLQGVRIVPAKEAIANG